MKKYCCWDIALEFQSLLCPEHYLPASKWDCLTDPRELITTKIHLIAAHLLSLKVHKPTEKTFFLVNRASDWSAASPCRGCDDGNPIVAST